jgi:hypothetical protein
LFLLILIGRSIVALNLIAAVLLGALVGLDRRIAGKDGPLPLNVMTSLFGFAAGSFLAGADLGGLSFDSSWGEALAAISLFALGIGARGDRSKPDEPVISIEPSGGEAIWRPAPDRRGDEDSSEMDAFHLVQALALGVACSFAAWTYVFCFILLMVVGYVWRTALTGAPSVALQQKPQPLRRSEPALPKILSQDLVAQQALARSARVSLVEWFDGQPPPSFVAALTEASREQETIPPRAATTPPEHRQTEAVHIAPKPLDARSAANTRPIRRGGGTVVQYKSRTEARGPAPGRR